MKQENPIEEIWRIREDIAKEDGFDLQVHFLRLRQLEQTHPERMQAVTEGTLAHSVKSGEPVLAAFENGALVFRSA